MLSYGADLQGRRCLFVSYFYPPAAGTGLPGTMRSVKFIRNLVNADIHVLTIKPEFYNQSVKRDPETRLPIKDESVHRSGVCDVFRFLLGLRFRLKSACRAERSTFPTTMQWFLQTPGTLATL